VKKHVSLRTMSMAARSYGLRDVADILAVDQDAPAAHVVERNSNREIVDLPAPDGPTMATLCPAATIETQDL